MRDSTDYDSVFISVIVDDAGNRNIGKGQQIYSRCFFD